MQQTTDSWLERIAADDYAFQPYHTSRYEFAATHVADKVVLDLACGVGYGTRFLAQRGARSVLGMDLEHTAIDRSAANSQNSSSQAYFSTGSATSIPLADRSVEVIVSMETIEHIAEAEQCLKEFRRVLSDKGLLILSTPNALVTKPIQGVPRNPFHVKEYEPVELVELLRRYFADVELLGQRVRGIQISSDGTGSTQPSTLVSRFVSLFPLTWRQELPKRLPRAVADRLVLHVTGHHMVLEADDLEFTADRVEDAPVLVALCTK
jgi:ubiquinone/menaquinone biosynthesis C-methylase UbiE